mgnify:CR=1 FL=1
MTKLLKHLFSLHEDEITGKTSKPSKEKKLMLQLTAVMASIGKVGKYIILGMIALALIIVTVKCASLYYAGKVDKEIKKATNEVVVKAYETIKATEDTAKVNTEALVESNEIKIETIDKKVSIDRITDNFVRDAEKAKTEREDKDKPVLVKKPFKPTETLVAPIDTYPVITTPHPYEVSHKVKVLYAMSDLMDNEISNLPALV